jgi:AraC-like DNA-binding protein
MATKLSIRVYSSTIRKHIHDYHQLFFPLLGGATCVISQEIYKVGLGQCILYPAGIEHYCIPDDNSKYLVVDLDELPEKLQDFEHLVVPVPPLLQAFIYFAEKQLDYRVNMSLEKRMGELVDELFRELDFQPRVDPRIARVMAFFERDPSSSASLDELSSLAGLSLSQFKALFKKQTGKTPGGFLRDLRMEKAKALLVNTDYPIGIIAEMVGYFDASSFSHRFSSHFGFPPRNLRTEYPILSV